MGRLCGPEREMGFSAPLIRLQAPPMRCDESFSRLPSCSPISNSSRSGAERECTMIGTQGRTWRPLLETVFRDSKVGSMGAGSGRNLPSLHDKTKVTTFVSWQQRNCDAGHCAGYLTAEPADPRFFPLTTLRWKMGKPALPAAQRTPRWCHRVW